MLKDNSLSLFSALLVICSSLFTPYIYAHSAQESAASPDLSAFDNCVNEQVQKKTATSPSAILDTCKPYLSSLLESTPPSAHQIIFDQIQHGIEHRLSGG